MKKLTTVLLTLTMVFGLAAMASAACFNCVGEAGNIARGCEGVQDSCCPFDFEGQSFECGPSYCTTGKTHNRALFKICDCIPEYFDTLEAGDTIDISMEILVDSGDGEETGDNGVYWAEDVGSEGIPMGTYANQSDACDEDRYDEDFTGPYKYLLADGDEGVVNEGSSCELDDEERVVKLEADRALAAEMGITTGYEIQPGDDFDNKATWAIDIPHLRVDSSKITAGDKVWVKICMVRFTGGICADEPCCCLIYIGELCCDSLRKSAGLVYPYFPEANSETWDLLGMTITNLDSVVGSAVITMYETDGTVGTLTVAVPANGIYLNTLGGLVADPGMVVTGTGTLGDANSYLVVTPDFNASGFAMIADTIDGASMGYLPQYGYGGSMVLE